MVSSLYIMVNTLSDVKWWRLALPKMPSWTGTCVYTKWRKQAQFLQLGGTMDYIHSCGSIYKGPRSPATHCVHLQCIQKSYLISPFLFSFGLLHVLCSVIMIIAVEIPHRYFVFLVIPLLRKWTMTGDTWSLTSIPLHADATKSITAKIHLCLLTKLRHTASSLYMFVLSRHSLTPFCNCWATSRSVDSVLKRVRTRVFCRWVFERPVGRDSHVLQIHFVSVILTILYGTVSNLTSCKVDEHASRISKANRDY
jgi:hypothetical protein